MIVKKDLKDIAEVIAGYSFRTALKGKEDASLFVLQAKNISDISSVNEENLDGIDFENYRSKAIVKKGDVVISSRGSFRSGSVGLGIKDMIAASSVYILRPKTKNIIPYYLAIYLNSYDGQKQLTESATGAAIKAIRRNDLENITITIPDLEAQKKIVNLYLTGKVLQKKLKRKMELINSINEEAINNILNK
jgi:restriction endonuclease S subunit